MSMARRPALLDWAHENDAWVLEDDYDSEFRFSEASRRHWLGSMARGA
jgi:DNA-binding transcriptional MocR family regulator